jgi:hypothetical protein
MSEAWERKDGISLKLAVCPALAAHGIKMASADLEDGTPRRRRHDGAQAQI